MSASEHYHEYSPVDGDTFWPQLIELVKVKRLELPPDWYEDDSDPLVALADLARQLEHRRSRAVYGLDQIIPLANDEGEWPDRPDLAAEYARCLGVLGIEPGSDDEEGLWSMSDM